MTISSALPAPASRRATDHVFHLLQLQIMRGELKEGERIDVDGLATELEVSRTPIREALIQLEREGLVDRRAYRGTVVASIDPVKLEENTALRIQLEGLAAELGARRITDRNLVQMEEILAELEKHVSSEDYSLGLFNELNRAFHGVIYTASGAGSLIQLIDNLQTEADRFRLHFDVRNSGADAEHRTILEACRARIPRDVCSSTQQHILNAYLRTRQVESVPGESAMLQAVVAAAGISPHYVEGARP